MVAEKLYSSAGAARGEILFVKYRLKPQILTISTYPWGTHRVCLSIAFWSHLRQVYVGKLEQSASCTRDNC